MASAAAGQPVSPEEFAALQAQVQELASSQQSMAAVVSTVDNRLEQILDSYKAQLGQEIQEYLQTHDNWMNNTIGRIVDMRLTEQGQRLELAAEAARNQLDALRTKILTLESKISATHPEAAEPAATGRPDSILAS